MKTVARIIVYSTSFIFKSFAMLCIAITCAGMSVIAGAVCVGILIKDYAERVN